MSPSIHFLSSEIVLEAQFASASVISCSCLLVTNHYSFPVLVAARSSFKNSTHLSSENFHPTRQDRICSQVIPKSERPKICLLEPSLTLHSGQTLLALLGNLLHPVAGLGYYRPQGVFLCLLSLIATIKIEICDKIIEALRPQEMIDDRGT
jgi:hypothetical protein